MLQNESRASFSLSLYLSLPLPLPLFLSLRLERMTKGSGFPSPLCGWTGYMVLCMRYRWAAAAARVEAIEMMVARRWMMGNDRSQSDALSAYQRSSSSEASL